MSDGPAALSDKSMLADMNCGGRTIAPVGFEENKGQVVTTRGEPAPFVHYRLSQGNTNIFLLETGIAYQFQRRSPSGSRAAGLAGTETAGEDATSDQARTETYRMDMVLEGADPHVRITTAGRSDDYTHYYNHPGSGIGQGVLDVRTYREVTYHDVYPGIDWVVSANGPGIAYDFVVKPYADPSLIRMRFTDHEELYLDDAGRLVHGNQLGRFTEEAPTCFQGTTEVTARFVLEGSLLRFEIGDHDPTKTLVIDPPRAWATYYGGPGWDFINAIATDTSGNVYAAGMTRSDNGIASPGNDTIFNPFGDDDAMLVKFNAFGARVWGIYYGWVQYDEFIGAAIDGAGNIYCAGSSSSDTYIATWGTQQYTLGGGYDAMLVKFRPDGTRIWGTYLGGAADDRGRSCAVDPNDNVFLAGLTQSDANISTPTCHQPVRGGNQDGFLAKFDTHGHALWGSYYGGSGNDAASDIAADANGNLVLAGTTGSTNGNSIAIAGHQNSLSGSTDGFLAKFNSNGNRQWGTYYGGVSSDSIFSCAADAAGNVIIAGRTNSVNGIAVLGAHQSARSGPTDAFLVKFSPSGTRQWGTYYGGESGDYGRSIASITDGDILLAGNTESQQNIASQGFQDTFGLGPSDAFLVRFTAEGARVFGTYYGGPAEDKGFDCTVDDNGSLYLTGYTRSFQGISADGTFAEAQQDFHAGGEFDGFLVKFGDGTLDCLGIPDGGILPGVACDDDETCTENDAWNLSCACTGALVDNDGDGVCDEFDLCPGGPDPGLLCDDGDTLTAIDFVNDDCICVGISFTCLLPEDCDDQNPCTTNACVGDSCVYTPYVIGAITGESLVVGGTIHVYSITPVPGATGYTWVLPPGWSSVDITQSMLEATAGTDGATAPLCVTVNFGPCALDTCIDVLVVPDGIHEPGQPIAPLFTVQPNPSEGLFEITLSGTSADGTRFEVLDAAGRTVHTPAVPSGQRTTLMDLRNLSPGMYLLRLSREQASRPLKLIIKR